MFKRVLCHLAYTLQGKQSLAQTYISGIVRIVRAIVYRIEIAHNTFSFIAIHLGKRVQFLINKYKNEVYCLCIA